MTYSDEKSGSLLNDDVNAANATIDQGQDAFLAKWTEFRFTPLRLLLFRVAWFLVPSFLQSRYMREHVRPMRLGPTAYLDGVRGVAALIVSFGHFTTPGYDTHIGWGVDGGNYQFMRLPFCRLVYSGGAAVAVFFAISGYVLSYKPIQHIRNGNWHTFSTGLSSMAFRRAIRLYLPPTISTAIIACIMQTGIFERTQAIENDRTYFNYNVPFHIQALPSASEEFTRWVDVVTGAFFPFSWDKYEPYQWYDGHLWTIPIEFRGSFYLFAVILATARLQTKYRLLTVAALMYHSYICSRWEFMLFLSGIPLVEWDHIRGAHITPSFLGEKEAAPSRSTLKTIFWHLVSALGLFLLSQPEEEGETTPGWAYLTSLIPEWWEVEQQRYWQSAGAVCFLFGVGHSPWWQQVFTSRIAQYLGKISYSIYLVHGPVHLLICMPWQKFVWDLTGVEGNAFHVGYALGVLFSIPMFIVIADIFWRAVDIPTVKFATNYEAKVSIKVN
ncbi:putative acyltransferase [Ilyonectria sp. MPI-CAGE-AT-0026]|nr:putative acyltransferase [Ilyonectria sp. MPI-CAGE-AT-0026]